MKKTSSLFVTIVAVLSAFAVACQTADDDPVDDQEQSEQVAVEVGQSIVHTGGAVVRLAEPLARALEDDGTMAADGPLKTRIEAALARLVAVAECLSVDWDLWRATVHFDECAIPTTDETIDGSMTVVVRPLRLEVVVTTDELTLGNHTFYGSFTGFLKGPLAAPTVGVDIDVTHAGSETTLMVSDLRVSGNLQQVTVGGTGAIASSTVDAAATADAVTWNLDECAPSSGTVDYTQGPLSGTITFLETTPTTGEVQLDIPPLPSQMIELFPACQ